MNSASSGTPPSQQALLKAVFARLDPLALATALALAAGLALFAATTTLLIKGAPPGFTVGPHLAVLSTYLPGYSVSWAGSLLGLVYGGLIGALIGMLIALLWNLSHRLYLIMLALRMNLFAD